MAKSYKLISQSKSTKAVKVRLTKEQKIRVSQMIRLENRISVCREYIKLWSKFFELFADDIQKRQISEQEEKAFFQTVTALARKLFLFMELTGDTFSGGDKILDVLVSSVALSNIKAMNEATLQKLEHDWHTIFLDMNVALGRLLRKLPGGTRIDDALAIADAMAQGGPAAGRGAGAAATPGVRDDKKRPWLSRLGGRAKA
jgi:hypothetical protein